MKIIIILKVRERIFLLVKDINDLFNRCLKKIVKDYII